MVYILCHCHVVRDLMTDCFGYEICETVFDLKYGDIVFFWLNLWHYVQPVEFVHIELFLWIIWDYKNKIMFQNIQFNKMAFDKLWKYSRSK